VVREVAAEYQKLSDREYGFLDKYKMEDAEVAVIGLGSTMGTARAVIDELRKEGKKVGLISLRLFQPFPRQTVKKAVKNVRVLGVLDRADTFSLQGGPLFSAVCNTLFESEEKIKVKNYIYGLGGRDITVTDLKNIFAELLEFRKQEVTERVTYFGVRE
ncbi:MAG: transketolase C-terminal domain-containing protein, partial [Bacillota bacterium]